MAENMIPFDSHALDILPSREKVANIILTRLKQNRKLALIGAAGIGKTYISRYISKILHNEGIEVNWITCKDITATRLFNIPDESNCLLVFDSYEDTPTDALRLLQYIIKNYARSLILITARKDIKIIPFFVLKGISISDARILMPWSSSVELTNEYLRHLLKITNCNPLGIIVLGQLINNNKNVVDEIVRNFEGTLGFSDESEYNSRLLLFAAQQFRKQQELSEALDFSFRALAVLKDNDSDELHVLIYLEIANMYSIMKEYTSALEYFLKACSIEITTLKATDIKLAETYSSIGDVYTKLYDFTKALEWYYKALVIREKTLGKEHPDTATAYNNIAKIYYIQGDYQKALELFFKAIEIQEQVLGKEHPDTATTYNNIALVFQVKGDYSRALEWFFKDLAISEKILGKEHPDTATTYNNIGGVYYSLGDYSKALEWYYKDLVISEKVLGKEHPDTATTYNNIAGVYRNQGDYSKALELFFKALVIREKVFGKEHPDTAITYNNIAGVYYEQGDYHTALEWLQKAFPIFEAKLGPDHPSTKNIRFGIEFITTKLASTDPA